MTAAITRYTLGEQAVQLERGIAQDISPIDAEPNRCKRPTNIVKGGDRGP